MRVFRGTQHRGIAPACALTIGNFDGVHRGHQAMLALLINEARHRGVPSCVLTFEPHPRDHFARLAGKPLAAPARVATLRDKLAARRGILFRQQLRLHSFSPRAAGEIPATLVLNGAETRHSICYAQPAPGYVLTYCHEPAG